MDSDNQRTQTTSQKQESVTPESSSVATSHTFQYDLLYDATKQIRLLEFVSDAYDEQVIFRMHTFDKEAAPPYAAISYVWGDPAKRECVWINGKTLLVTSHCFYVLEQVTIQLPKLHDQYFWIDYICINQENIREKSLQVRDMGNIYRRANVVLSCVGLHAQDTPFLYRLIRALKNDKDGPFCSSNFQMHTRSSARTASFLKSMLRLWRSWGQEGSFPDFHRRFRDARMKFCERRYWSRLWIVQETRLASAIHLLCGTDIMQMDLLAATFAATRDGYDLDFQSTIFPAPREEYSAPSANLLTGLKDTQYFPGRDEDESEDPLPIKKFRPYEAFDLFAAHECSDFRDRLYAILEIIDWPKTASPTPVQPNYELSKSGIAIQLAEKIFHDLESSRQWYLQAEYDGIRAITSLRFALGLDMNDEELASLIEQKIIRDTKAWNAFNLQRASVRAHHRSLPNDYEHYLTDASKSLEDGYEYHFTDTDEFIRLSPDGRLWLTFRKRQNDAVPEHFLTIWNRGSKLSSSSPVDPRGVYRFIDLAIAAIACDGEFQARQSMET